MKQLEPSHLQHAFSVTSRNWQGKYCFAGGAGFIASHVVNLLVSKYPGYKVLIMGGQHRSKARQVMSAELTMRLAGRCA